MNTVTSVTYYIQFWNILSFYQNKVISFLMLLVLNYTTKCMFFLAFRFTIYCEAVKHGNNWISAYFLFKF